MAKVNEKENPTLRLNEDLKNQTFARAYLLYGEERYLVDQYKKRLTAAILPDGDTMNFNTYNGKDISVPAIIDVAETMPFFADYRLLLLEETGLYNANGEALANYLEQAPETTIFLFVESEVDARTKLYKMVKQIGYVAKLERQSGELLTKWVLGRMKKEGKAISRDTLDRFFELAGDDMQNIDSELEKLFSYCMGRESITIADVNAVGAGLASDHIFDMTDAISRKQADKAMGFYNELKILQEPAPRILAMITNQFQRLLLMKEARGEGLDNYAIAKRLGYKSDYPVKKNMPLVQSFTVQELKDAVRLCVEADESFKTGRMTDTLALETLIIELVHNQ